MVPKEAGAVANCAADSTVALTVIFIFAGAVAAAACLLVLRYRGGGSIRPTRTWTTPRTIDLDRGVSYSYDGDEQR